MAKSSFTGGTDIGPSPVAGGSRTLGTATYNHLGFSLQSGKYSGPGFDATINSIPITYVRPFDDPRWALKFAVPLSYAKINGETFFSAAITASLRIPVYDFWTLTPQIGYGMTKNQAPLSPSMIAHDKTRMKTASITSNFKHELPNGMLLTIGNSYTRSESVERFGYECCVFEQFKLKNDTYQNGLELSGPMKVKLWGLPTNWQASIVHGRTTGTPTLVNDWIDYSVSVGSVSPKNGVTWDSVRVGLTFTDANAGVNGVNLNFGYEF